MPVGPKRKRVTITIDVPTYKLDKALLQAQKLVEVVEAAYEAPPGSVPGGKPTVVKVAIS